MNFLIGGSVAMHHWFPDSREPKDIDIFTRTKQEHQNGKIRTEFHCDPPIYLCMDINQDKTFLDADVLLTLKMSHANWDIKWKKTIHDICFLLDKGVRPNRALYDVLVKLWEPIHGKKPGNLNQGADNFFSDAVKRKYNHDWLHEQVAFFDHPLYFKILRDGSEVMCDSYKFYSLTQEEQSKCIYEELIVTAIERFNLTKESPKHAIATAVLKCHQKLILTMSKGWFSYELIYHYYKLHSRNGNDWKMVITQLNKTLEKLK